MSWVLTLGAGVCWSQITVPGSRHGHRVCGAVPCLFSLWQGTATVLLSAMLSAWPPLGACVRWSATEQLWTWHCSCSLQHLHSQAALSEHTAPEKLWHYGCSTGSRVVALVGDRYPGRVQEAKLEQNIEPVLSLPRPGL